ncbi:nitrous oxide reductase accessory protein NosL [bacterium]|nr:nitrous oxide reductase accessory protein NosL [bacterium]MBU1991346.1 nitrous oxide reductase accessory protein NosL [bacterium]
MFIGRLVVFITMLFSPHILLSANSEYSHAVKIKKIYPMGEKIYKKNCNEIRLADYKNYEELKTEIAAKKLCKVLKEKHLEAVSLYLWEYKRVQKSTNIESIKVNENEKCPVCGMFVYKYPKWAAQIFYEDRHYSFDGVKDMMKYYFDNMDKIEKMLVTDYYSQKAIDARSAFYVLGSDIYGPMGAELIPFESQSDAKVFYLDHKAAKILRFKEISQMQVYKLDE